MSRYEIVCADNLEWMENCESDTFDVTFTSPPYENARIYGELGFKLKGQEWVDWMIPRVCEMCRVTKGIVFINMAAKVRNFRYSPAVEWLVSDLTRYHGIILAPSPYCFYRNGIPGSGAKHYHRRDWEPIYGFTLPKNLPLSWSDNTATGHSPKWAPGGAMSHQTASGTRVGKRPSNRIVGGRDQWGGTGHRSGGDGRHANGKHKGMSFIDKKESGAKIHTKRDADETRLQAYLPPVTANSGNVISCKVGGGHMGHKLAHENEAAFPLKLAEFFILSYCPPEGTAFDPFCGSGTTIHAAVKLGRRGVGVEARDSQVANALQRLSQVQVNLIP